MKKIVILLSLLCVFSCNFSVQAATTTSAEITKIEKHVFGYDYAEEPDSERINRLEKFAYGTTGSGNLQNRIEKLKTDMNVPTTNEIASAQPQRSTYDYDDIQYEQSDSTVQYPVVDALEEKIFNKISSNEDIYSRVAKLEKKIFKKEEPNKSLNDRVDKLKTAVITDVGVAGYDDNGDITILPTMPQAKQYDDIYTGIPQSNYYSSDILANGSLYNEISMLERDILQETFPMMSVENRLAQLETKVLQRNYSNDDNHTRLERLAAAAEAQKNASSYRGSKFEKNLATGMQIASFLLMVLAFIL